MKINIKTGATVDLTAPLKTYITMRLSPLAKFIKKFDDTGEAELWLELSRTTKHHRKGEVFMAVADLRLPGKILRAEEYATDIRKAVDQAKDTLRVEIEKYKTKFVEVRREKRGKNS